MVLTQSALEAVDDTLTVAAVVRLLRERHGLTARALSLQAGLSESYVGKVEKGEIQPSLCAFGRIAFQLGMSQREIFAVVMQEARR
jgi:transcriptional regulator with XRE-family HTH domain